MGECGCESIVRGKGGESEATGQNGVDLAGNS